ncbi:hypothetical protein FOZ63_033688, partial [Perkinsus olseni]
SGRAASANPESSDHSGCIGYTAFGEFDDELGDWQRDEEEIPSTTTKLVVPTTIKVISVPRPERFLSRPQSSATTSSEARALCDQEGPLRSSKWGSGDLAA